MKTPYFLILEDILDDNILAFQKSLKELWPNSQIAYSVKTNSLPWILKYLKTKELLAEVVSDEEYQLAKLCGYCDEQIVFNGPIKGEMQFAEGINRKAIINLDSARDLEYLEKYRNGCCEKIGIRVNVPVSVFQQKDIGYEADGFRFGFSEKNGEFEKALNCVRNIYGDCRLGLHLHCNSITRSVDVYTGIARYAVTLIRKYHLALSYIDMGGGYFGGVEGKPSAFDYISAIRKELESVIDPEQTKLIIEPGSSIIGSAVELHTSVLDVKDTDYSRIVTTDGSRVHIDPLWAKSKYRYFVKPLKKGKVLKKQIICGYTCMDHDRIMILENEPELEIGDKIIYQRVGAYSMTFGGMFIRYLPEVYVKNQQGAPRGKKPGFCKGLL